MILDGRNLTKYLWGAGIAVFAIVALVSGLGIPTQVAVGDLAALVTVVGMAVYAVIFYQLRQYSRRQFDAVQLPEPADGPPRTAPPASLAKIEQALLGMGFTRAGELRSDRATIWRYIDKAATTRANVIHTPAARSLQVTLATYFEDGFERVTVFGRLSRIFDRPDYQSQSVGWTELLATHQAAVQQLIPAHGQPVSIAAWAQEAAVAAKYFRQRMRYQFDAAWRINFNWLIAIEAVGLLALIGGLIELNDPPGTAIRGLAILVGAAMLLGWAAWSVVRAVVRLRAK